MSKEAKAVKEITGKRSKTDADMEEISRREWLGGLYLTKDGRPCLPYTAIEAVLVAGAKKSKSGPQAKSGILVEQNPEIIYDGPKDPQAMWEDGRFVLTVGVRVNKGRVMRTRPIFENWAIEAEILHDPGIVSANSVADFARVAGEQVGLCEWRPRYGRFRVERL